MNRSYWDTSSILADAVRIPCHVARDCPGLAHLQGNNEAIGSSSSNHPSSNSRTDDELNDQDEISKQKAIKKDYQSILRKNTRIDVPFWLAELLALHGIVNLSVPRPYSAKVRNALDAEAKSVQLRHLSAWWYAIGIRLGALMEAEELLNKLQITYSSRIRQIFSSGQHLAASSNMRKASDGQSEISSNFNENVDSLGAYSAISMSAEMVEFINGLEEVEVQCEFLNFALKHFCFLMSSPTLLFFCSTQNGTRIGLLYSSISG